RVPVEVAGDHERLVDGQAPTLVGEPVALEALGSVVAVERTGDGGHPGAPGVEEVVDRRRRRVEVLDVDDVDVVAWELGADDEGLDRRVEQLVDPRFAEGDGADDDAVEDAV